jgi:hypothetical protein
MFAVEESPDEELARLLAAAPDWPPLEEVLDRIVTDGPPHSDPSGWSALELDTGTADHEVLSDAEVIDAIVGFEQVVAWAGARQARLLAEFARRRPGDDRESASSDTASPISRWAPDEVGLALSISRMTAGARLAQARRLVEVLPATLAAFEAGRIDATKVRAIHDATVHLSRGSAEWVQDRVLAAAPQQSRAQLVAALGRAVIAVDPEGANERHRRARTDRRVVVGQESEGMASLWALLAAPDALAAHQWLTRMAHGLGQDDPRTMDQRRADLLGDLLTGQITIAHGVAEDEPDPAGRSRPREVRPVTPGKPLVQVVVPYSTLTGAGHQPGELVGYGAIPADLAREIAADGVWKRLLTDPASGALLDHGRTTYRPPAALADFVRARDVHCRSPLCRRRAIDSELDHTIPYPLGPTADHNLTDGCALHHHEKHSPGWTVLQRADGRVEWITPTGHRYTSEPFDYRLDPAPPRAGPRRPQPVPPPRDTGWKHADPRSDGDPAPF